MTWLALRAELAEEFSDIRVEPYLCGIGTPIGPPPKTRTEIPYKESKASRRARYLRRKATGLCAHCPNQPEPGRSVCATCLAAVAQPPYRARAASGLCGRCGRQPAPGKRLCAGCARKCAQAVAKRRRQKRTDLVIGVEGGK